MSGMSVSQNNISRGGVWNVYIVYINRGSVGDFAIRVDFVDM